MSDLLERIEPVRLADGLWKLVNTPSPTGKERQAAFLFAELLREAGADVRVDETLPSSPSVIGRVHGNTSGPTLQLAGHLDHINVPHAPPVREGSRISGRGALDMKSGLACILEVVRVLWADGCRFPGEILITAYGLHETPVGDGAGVRNLIEQGIVGDAALVFEGPTGGAVVMGKGQSIWNVVLRGSGAPCHELARDRSAPDLFGAAGAALRGLEAERKRLASKESRYPLLGAESLFIGQMHCGDFYNRTPVRCHIQGTRRWNPDRSFEEVKREFEGVVAEFALPSGIESAVDWVFAGEAYEVDPEAGLIRALRASYEEIEGIELPLMGMGSVCDTSKLVPLGGIPTAVWGVEGSTAHADFEYVELDKLTEACRMHVLTTMKYLQGAS